MHQKVPKNKKTIHPKKDNIGDNKKNNSSGFNRVVTSNQIIQQPINGKQAPKEKAKTEDSNKEEKKKIYILGDSMIKHLKGCDIPAKLKQHHSIYVQPFTGAKVRSMKDYVKPCIREDNLDHIILHVETNELSSKNNAEKVGKSIVDPAKSPLSENQKVIISGIIPRNDEWNNKVLNKLTTIRKKCARV